MRLRYSKYSINDGMQKIKTKTALGLSTLVLAFAGTGGISVLTFGSAHAASPNENGCSFVETPSSWTLRSDCSSTAEINVPAGITLVGSGYTISPTFTKTDNSNNAALGVLSDNVTVKNLTINGVGGKNLHGINVFETAGVVLNDVTLKNNKHSGLVVNGSNVTVNNITTMQNGLYWGGIDVDQGSGVTTAAALTVNGTSTQTEPLSLDIHVDDTSKNVSVVDTNAQYLVTSDGNVGAVYTLKSTASTKDSCKNSGWQNLRNTSGGFKNQGACVSYVASNGKSQH